jgi:hypothetical protein
MKLPTQEQIDSGVLVSDYCYDLSIYKALGGVKPTPPNDKIGDIGELYVIGEINAVIAIYLAMTLEK